MLTAIPRYGARVLPNTIQLVSANDSISFRRMACYYTFTALDLPPGGEVVLQG